MVREMNIGSAYLDRSLGRCTGSVPKLDASPKSRSRQYTDLNS